MSKRVERKGRSVEKFRRRRPGESWRLWMMVGKEGAKAGYLVTTEEHAPTPITRVSGPWRPALRQAVRVRNDTIGRRFRYNPDEVLSYECGKQIGKDGLPRRGTAYISGVVGFLLLPVDGKGRIITTDRTFAAGEFRWEQGGGVGFAMYSHHGLRMILEKNPELLPEYHPSRRERDSVKNAVPFQKGPHTMTLNAPMPASNASDKDAIVAAA